MSYLILKLNQLSEKEYAHLVFYRYVKRFGYLDPYKAVAFIKKRFGYRKWHLNLNPGYINFQPYGHYRGPANIFGYFYQDIEGFFCPIGRVAGEDERGYPDNIYCCPYCGSGLRVKKGIVLKPYFYGEESDSIIWSFKLFSEDQLECIDSRCVEAQAFIRGKHDLIDTGKKLKIKPNRPLSLYRESPHHVKGVLAASSLLDFQSRILEKINHQQGR